MSWEPIATHGMSEAEVRAALEEYNAAALHDLRLQLRANDELTLPEIEKIMAFAKDVARKRLDHDLPTMMRNMAITAGAEALH